MAECLPLDSQRVGHLLEGGEQPVQVLFGVGGGAGDAQQVLRGGWPQHGVDIDAFVQQRLAEAIGIEPGRVTVRATSTDGIGFTGRGEGLAAQAVALLER